MKVSKPIIGFRIEFIIEPDDEGFHAYCPALKGLHTCGDSEEEAIRNVRDAAIAYLQSSIEHGDPIPLGIMLHSASGKRPHTPIKHAIRRTEDLKVACTI